MQFDILLKGPSEHFFGASKIWEEGNQHLLVTYCAH